MAPGLQKRTPDGQEFYSKQIWKANNMFDPPAVIETIHWGAIIGYSLLGLLGMVWVLLTSRILSESSEVGLKGVTHLIGMYVLGISVLRFYRAAPPHITSDNLAWWITTLSFIALAAVLGFLVGKADGTSGSLLIFGGSVISTIVISAGIDKANETLGSIPLSWGALAILGVAIFLLLKEN